MHRGQSLLRAPTMTDISNRLTKSTEFAETQAKLRSRNATIANPLKSRDLNVFLRKPSIPTKTHTTYNSPEKEHARGQHSRARTEQRQLLSTLCNNILKQKHSIIKTMLTEKQKERYLHRLGQTISGDKFKTTGFELDHECLTFVFDYIRHINCIRRIILDGNPLGNQGVIKLATLVQTAEIVELSIVSVGMGNKGASALFSALAVRSTIRKLNFSSSDGAIKNKVTAEGVENMKELLNLSTCCLDTLRMDYIFLGNEGLKSGFEGVISPPLELLSLSKNELSFKRISNFTISISSIALQRLDLSKNNLSDEGIKALNDLFGINYGKTRISTNLSLLNLSGNNITSLGFQSFCREMYCNQTLETLILDDNPLGEGDRFFNIRYYLNKNWRLKKLSLGNIGCNEKNLRCLCQALQTNRSLQSLNISKNEVDSDTFCSIIVMLNRNKSLREIAMNSCKISDNYLLKNEFLLTTSSFSQIEQIQMENNYIGNKGADLIKDVLASNQNILKISLTKNCIGERSLLSISQLLKENQRKRPFERQLNYFQSMVELYEDKKKNLKGEVQKMKEYEQELKTHQLAQEIIKKQRQEDALNRQIKIQKRSIAKIVKRRRHTKPNLKHYSQQQQVAYLTQFKPQTSSHRTSLQPFGIITFRAQ